MELCFFNLELYQYPVHMFNLIDFEKIISHGIIFIFILKSCFNVLLMEWVQISK
jgi:type II secretory pathway component PulC